MRPLKIALVSQFLWLENHFHYEGEDGAAMQLAEAVAALGHEVVVLSQSSEVRKLKKIDMCSLETWVSPRDRHRDILTGFRDRRAAKTYSYSQPYSDALAIREFLARRGPFDVIWAHAESPDGLALALAAQMGVKLPPILQHVQNLRCRFEKGQLVFTAKKALGLAFKNAKRLLPVSDLIAENMLAYAGPEISADAIKAKTQVVYPNLRRGFLEPEPSSVESAPMKDRILYIGGLNVLKGALVFLDALPKTEFSTRSSSVAIAGGFTDYSPRFQKRWEVAKEEARKLLRGSRMEYLGRVSSYEVIRQIKLAQAVVIPSIYDGFARGLVEALVVGRPVVTTDQVGSSHIVRDRNCGIIVAPNDSESLAHAIDAVLNPIVPFAENARKAGPELAPYFLPQTIAVQVEKHLLEVAER